MVMEEVYECDGSKLVGLGGFNFKFYKNIWPLICLDMLDLVSEFFRSKRLPSCAYVALIPKIKLPKGFFDYIPISMVREIYKIMAKILLNILKHVIQDATSDNQKTFIAGRHKVDGFIIANKVAHDLHEWRKAFDEMMGFMGFGNKWRRLIHECLSV